MQHIYAVPAAPSIFENDIPPRLVYLSHAEMDRSGDSRPMHAHADFTELSVILRGEGWHRIGEAVYHSRPGDLVIFNAGVVHDEHALSDEPVETFCLGMTGVYLRGRRPGQLVEDGAALLHCGERFALIREQLALLEQLLATGGAQAGPLAHGAAAALCILVRELAAGQGTEAEPVRPGSAIVQAMRSYIDRYYAEDFTLDDLAAHFGVSRFYAAHIFRAETGYSPIQYRLRRRMGEAQSLLTDTDYSITYIAGAVGYDNPNHFTQRFTRMVGVSPSAYRSLSIQTRLPPRPR